MYCDRCGYKLSDDAKFCENCGSEMVDLRKNEGNRVRSKNKFSRSGVSTKKQNVKKMIIATTGVVVLLMLVILLIIKVSGFLVGNEESKEGEKSESVEDSKLDISKETETDFFETYEFELEKENNAIYQEESILNEAESDTKHSGNVLDDRTSVNGDSSTNLDNETVQKIVKESTYEFVKGNYTWLQANQECLKRGGHLVHFDTPGEAEKVISMFIQSGHNNKSMFWIGGARNSSASSFAYHWIGADGTYEEEIPLDDSHWMKNEPSYIDPGLDNLIEDKMMMFFYEEENRWVWNDEYNSPQDYMPNYKERIGFICEYEK